MKSSGLFRDSDYNGPAKRICSRCGCRIPASRQGDLCNECMRIVLFPEVKEFVNNNDVNEVELAAHFNIEREIIKDWIREGRLEHKVRH